MDRSMIPNVITTLKKSDQNFTFHVTAYRKLSEQEMYAALKVWMRQNNLKRIPRNRIVNYILTVGFNE